ncbi:helix-turn-helix transcriptional regulator [Halomonas sp. ML-15]|uniref:helix-turn-helix transcriptional regulator n=1 Tax=Halomonas sp. ML-15 TaxID=2773305 RepID=UPI001747279B|nr:helix-turn-helix transcriptional regulator [Halomonas sp. ML-15]MBD3894928.1 helix-turn-helix transcriptional regulator [Halomonas sp. ML-15]
MPTSTLQRYSRDDFIDYGQRFGIAYHFARRGPLPVVQGRVEEFTLRPGMRLTHSDVEVLQHYGSSSLQSARLLVVIVLEGGVRLRLGDADLHLRAGMACSTQLTGPAHALHASQVPGQRLRTLTLGLEEAAALPQLALDSAATPSAWHLPEPLQRSLEYALEGQWQAGPHRLMMEGLALQLLAHAQHAGPVDAPRHYAPERVNFSPREQARLEAVRQRLLQQPMEAYRLEDLARLAAMSPSSLRSKFRQSYGQSVFDCLRERRLTLAQEYLAQGLSVQQTALRCGYRHASNFTTAFRRHFGVSPRRLTRSLA